MIPQFETKSELFTYLKANKSDLIARKKSAVKYSQPISYSPAGVVTKDNSPVSEDVDELNVKVVSNSTMVLDSDMDVLITGCYDDTVKDRKDITPHLHDHIHKIDAKVGEVQDIYTENITLSELGFNKSGSTECLIFETNVIKSYNEHVFNQYKSGKIKQHSIGLTYEKIDLAINDEDSEKEKEFFDKYIDKIINPEKAIEKGFFWVVQKIGLIENSAVLFGSNHATPTLDNNVKAEKSGKKEFIKTKEKII